VARMRQARRCRAHRGDGQPCRAWAMMGGFVCRAHGGSASRVRYAAHCRLTEANCLREFEVTYARLLRELAAWHWERVTVTAQLLGIRPADVRPSDIGVCRGWFGVPAGPETAPRIRHDRRFGPRAA
jgi:hypothetical protein